MLLLVYTMNLWLYAVGTWTEHCSNFFRHRSERNKQGVENYLRFLTMENIIASYLRTISGKSSLKMQRCIASEIYARPRGDNFLRSFCHTIWELNQLRARMVAATRPICPWCMIFQTGISFSYTKKKMLHYHRRRQNIYLVAFKTKIL